VLSHWATLQSPPPETEGFQGPAGNPNRREEVAITAPHDGVGTKQEATSAGHDHDLGEAQGDDEHLGDLASGNPATHGSRVREASGMTPNAATRARSRGRDQTIGNEVVPDELRTWTADSSARGQRSSDHGPVEYDRRSPGSSRRLKVDSPDWTGGWPQKSTGRIGPQKAKRSAVPRDPKTPVNGV